MGRKLLIGLSVGAALALAGCDDELKDSVKSGQTVDRSAAHVLAFPDQFRNVAAKCDGHNRVYSSSTGKSGNAAQLYVVPNDEQCSGAGQ